MTWHPDTPAEYMNIITTADARELSARLPDESVDLIFTDPPYPKEYIDLYGWLAKTAARVLKPGGLCITLAGHIYLDEVIELMGKHLKWHWIGGMPNTLGSVGRVHPRQMMCAWKPVLWYSKGQARPHAYIFDLFRGGGADKRYHVWGQPAVWCLYYIEKLTRPGAVVFDPFTGGGTVPAVCKMLGRNWVAFEIDPATAERARERVALTQVPLLVPEPEQSTFDWSAA